MTAHRTIETIDDVAEGMEHLLRVEPRFERAFTAAGMPPLRRQPAGLAALLYIITEQQISLAAAAAIWRRFEKRFHPFDPLVLLAAGDDDYRACGQSGAKIRTIRALAEALRAGSVDLDRMAQLEDAPARKELMAIKGIGPWTADIYLLSCLGRRNVWPSGDLALQVAAQLVFDLAQRPDRTEMEELAQDWQPWRAVAARLLWAHYRKVKLDRA